MKSKDLKNIIKYSDYFNPNEKIWNEIKTYKETACPWKIIELKRNNRVKRGIMKIRKRIIAAAAFVCVIAVTAGVFLNAQPAKAESTNLMKGITKSYNIQTQSNLSDNFIKSTSNFSMELFKQTAAANNKGNILISPTSSYLALGLTLNGADGETKKIMENSLGKYGLTTNELNINYKALMEKFEEKKGDTVINIANSVWYNKNLNVKKDFLQTNADYFNAGAYETDFKDKNSVNNINSWVKSNTHNLIDKMVDKIENDTVMYLINTIYFKGKWKEPFIEEYTSKDNFKVNGKNVQTDFMNRGSGVSYIQTKNEQAVLLPYNDGNFSFLAILPNENTDVRKYVKGLDENSIKNIMAGMKEKWIELKLPKFNAKFEISMNNELTNMGLGNIFSKQKADFSKMADVSTSNNIYVSEVKQKTFIKVTEEGTEAAAATKVEMKCGAVAKPVVVNFNHPFVYAIVDNKTGLPMFLGIMENPTEK